MRAAHEVEQAIGIDWYVSDADGIGGRIKDRPGDFRVTEIERFEPDPLSADPGGYPHVLLRVRLRGWDTHDFASALSDALGISRERVSWAGTKDKHAVTTQLFSVERGDPDGIAAVDFDGVAIEILGRTGRPILFGDLAGNRFQVTVRDPEEPGRVAAITNSLSRFGAGEDRIGVPNLFGQQRFGSRRAVTHEVGLDIVSGDWEGAVLTYVGNPDEREPAGTREARAFVEETRDWAGATERLPDRLGYERAICQRLATNGADEPADFRAALGALPENLQQLFVNAAQSYVFNRICSERLGRGIPFDEPVAGDVICFADRDTPDGVVLPDLDRTQLLTGDRLGTGRRHVERGRAFVTAPLVGTDTEFGEGEPAAISRDVLAEVGIDRSDFELPDPFGSTGTRRAILVETDLTVEHDPLTFAFALPKGSYATVLLREYLKVDPAAMS